MRRKCNGAKNHTEAWEWYYVLLVDERCVTLCSYSGSSGGGSTSENAGMSSENYVRIIMVENLRFPGEGSSAQG